MAKQSKTPKKKRAAILFKLVSSVSGYYYLARRNPKKRPNKMEFMKYDPVLRKHVLFKEQKLG
jgi:large subunit ribosomal protein L33